MKAESAVLAVCTLCIFLAFYFSFLSFQLADDASKKQSVNFAVYALIAGVMLLVCFAIYLGIKKALLKGLSQN